MQWFFEEDKTRSVFTADEHIRSAHNSVPTPRLPKRAVVFCMSAGLKTIRAHYQVEVLIEKLPGFVNYTEVLAIKGYPHVCFLHGGYGAPSAACTVETIRALGVEEIILVGLCGAFSDKVNVGDAVIPAKILSEEGTSRYYRDDFDFAELNSSYDLKKVREYFESSGHTAHNEHTVTSDAVFRQTFYKENLWRKKGCVGVDMEASAIVTICNSYGMKSTVILMASDKHPLDENQPKWVWGNGDFTATQEKFVSTCISLVIGQNNI